MSIIARSISLLIIFFQFSSCKTVFKTEGLPSATSLACQSLLADKLALTSDYDINSKATESNRENEKSPFTDRMEKSQCFNEVRWVSQPEDLKKFDRTIKLSYSTHTSSVKIVGHTLWVMLSAATLFLVPYHGNFHNEMILEDSKTGFKKVYPYDVSLTMHLFYFFQYAQTHLDEQQIVNIYDDFISELKAKK